MSTVENSMSPKIQTFRNNEIEKTKLALQWSHEISKDKLLMKISETILRIEALAIALFNSYSLGALTALMPTVGSFLTKLGLWSIFMSNPILISIVLCINIIIAYTLITRSIHLQETSNEINNFLLKDLKETSDMIYDIQKEIL